MEWLEEKIAHEFKKDKWEVKTLGEIITSDTLVGNSKITNIYKGDGNCPAIVSGDVLEPGICIEKCKVFVNESLASLQSPIEKGDLLIVANSAVDKLCATKAYLGEQKCAAGGDITVIKHSQNPKYLSYIWASKYVKKQVNAFCVGASRRTHVNRSDLLKIKLFIPDIETQNQIVEFLDKFIDLEHKLKKEMEKRDTQFEYYKELIANIGASSHEMVRSKDISGVQEGQMRNKNSRGNSY